MSKQSISTSMAPEVIIGQVAGNLQVRGWENPEVVVRANPEDLQMESQEDVVRLSCQGECDVRLPHGATIQVEAVHGNAQFRSLEDELAVGQVDGSLGLRNVATTRVEAIHGELSARAISGDLEVGQVHGNAQARDVQGHCTLKEVMGNLDLRDVEGDIRAIAEGNARLRLSVMMGSQYQVQAEGNLQCRIPEDASLKASLSSEAGIIRVLTPEISKTFQQEQCELTLGDGEATMQLAAGGLLYLTGQGGWEEAGQGLAGADEGYVRLPEDFGEQISQQVEAQIEAQMQTVTRQISEQMDLLTQRFNSAGMSPEEVERIMAQARLVSERETARAQEKMRRAQEKLERKLESAQRQREKAADRRTRASGRHSWSFGWPPPPPSPAEPPLAPVSDEERLMILRMLEHKKIGLEEAEQLLTALEGKE
jgi:hypothetical protein